MDAKAAARLIAEKGIFGLGGYDGCMCTNFEVQGVHIDISCRKSSGGSMFKDFYGTTIRVWTNHLDGDAKGLGQVAAEVIREVRKNEGHLPIKLRFCGYKYDAEKSCTYCGKPRPDQERYLCTKCQDGQTPFGDRIAENHAFDSIHYDLIEDAARDPEDEHHS